MVFRPITAEGLLPGYKRIPFQKEDKVILNVYAIYMYSKFTASTYKAKPDRIEEKHISTIMSDNFKTPLLVTDTTSS